MTETMRARELRFLLYEVLDTEALCAWPRFAEHSRATFDAALDAALRLARERFAPHAAASDAQEPTFDGARVHLIPEIKAALDDYVAAGFMGAAFPPEVGGLGLPYSVSQACAAAFYAANVATAAYPLLTQGAANLLLHFGSPAQQLRYMRPMIEGRFFGTMCLSEPHAGSSLGDLRTRAEPDGHGHYLLRGDKMWISGGEHDLAENIIHLVLARLPGAPAGVKGLSLFIVPRRLVGDDGELGPRNDVTLVGLNHKMGYRGTVNTALSFGDRGACYAELLGEPHEGLLAMFQMMNEARIAVGLGAASLAYAGLRASLDYARARPQGRRPGQNDPALPQVAIADHADVRRMLLAQKAFSEGALALTLYCARLVDERALAQGDEARHWELSELLGLLTPVAKAWPSQLCVQSSDLAIQVLGGYGYTRDYPVERLYRDNRLNPIHEGTNGIQAIDLLGRKVARTQGQALALLLKRVQRTTRQARDQEALRPWAEALDDACGALSEATRALLEAAARGEAELALANATVYMEVFGHIAVAWLWLCQAQAAQHGLASTASEPERAFYLGKLQACQYFFGWELPTIDPKVALLKRLDPTCLHADPAWL
jgi:alkylation response protein AidB-like acyl-CoA dehydrogenase